MGAGALSRTSLPLGDAVPSLARWGLSSDADLVFRTLTTFGPRPVPAIVRDLGMATPRVDAAMAELHAAGAVSPAAHRRSAGRRSPTWAGRPPTEVLDRIRASRIHASRNRPGAAGDRLRGQADVAAALERLGGGGVPGMALLPGEISDGVRYLRTRVLTRQRLAELMAVEEREQLAINTEMHFDAESARAGAALDTKLIERGVNLRCLGLPSADGDRGVEVEEDQAAGCEYREADDLPLKLIVIDHRIALFPVDQDDFDRGYLELSQPAVVQALVTLFDSHWATAIDPRRSGMPTIVLSERERQVVRLLTLGLTDAKAAAELQITDRAVTKILRKLMDRLGVENRFQLGLALGALRVARPPALAPPSVPSESVPSESMPSESMPSEES
jgi:DNA-binding CsgD family transcriptional regulator